ncbi:MAG: hypothetical protein GX025_04620 [Clostridiales bacterium]|nr:hypothetical protein [Clostridiales bacterium]
MDNNNFENITDGLDGQELSLESILAEFKAESEVYGKAEDKAEDKSHPIVMENSSQNAGEAKISSAMDFIESVAVDEPLEKSSARKSFQDRDKDAFFPSVEKSTAEHSAKAFPAEEKTDFPSFEKPQKNPPPPEKPKPLTDEDIWNMAANIESSSESYAPSGEYSVLEDDVPEEPDLREKFYAPLIGLISSASAKREEKRLKKKERAEQRRKDTPPELPSQRASDLYAAQALSLRLRCILAAGLCLVLLYLSYGLPAFGILGSSLIIRAFVCLVFQLVVMLIGLDVITNGLMRLFKGKPSVESLISVSCLVSAVDAVVMVITGNTALGLPFCAVSSLSVLFALCGSYLSCAGYALSFKVASLPKDPSVVMSQQNIGEDGRVLAKAKRPVTGFVRESEQSDVFEMVYSFLAPFLLVAAPVLSLFCFIASDKCASFLRTLSACTSVSASFSALLGFALPFYVLTKRLARSGVAIAGYSGASELGRLRQVVITDTDLFPRRTVSIADISIEEGSYPDKVISYTGSMIAAAGLGIAPVFTELMKKNNCSMQRVEDFACHEGGGVVARINGDKVYVGSASFIRLMGIRVEKGSVSASAVCIAVNDVYVGSFEINYTPITSVQRALVSLLSRKTQPLFAIRDFNITPMLVKQKFRLPSSSYDFPSFADRYLISSEESLENGSVVGMFARGGLNSVAGLMLRGRRLYLGSVLCAALSVFGTLAGMVLMLSLCWAGAFDSAGVANVLTFMLLWLSPVLVISLWLKN